MRLAPADAERNHGRLAGARRRIARFLSWLAAHLDEIGINVGFAVFFAWAIVSVLTLWRRSSTSTTERLHDADDLLHRMAHDVIAFKYPANVPQARQYRLLDPNDAHAEQGHRMFELGHVAAAAASFRAAIRQRPSDPHAWTDLAAVLRDSRMPGSRSTNAHEAALCAGRAHAIDPRHVDESFEFTRARASAMKKQQ